MTEPYGNLPTVYLIQNYCNSAPNSFIIISKDTQVSQKLDQFLCSG